MARVIPQNQPDPFAPQAARLYGTSSRPSTAFQTIGNTAGAIKSVADSPLTGLAIRGGQALKQGIEDYGLSKAAERRLAYETGLGAQESDADLEPYKPMQGLSLQGDQPEGLGLSLNDGTDWSADDKKPQGWSSESRMGELQSALGADLAKRAAAPAAPAARRRLADMGVLGAFTSPRAGTLPDEEVIRLEDVVRPAAPAAPQTPMPTLPRVRKAPTGGLPPMEFGGGLGAVKPLSLSDEPLAQEPVPPPPPIAQETDEDRARAMQATEPVEPPTPMPTGMDRFKLPPELDDPLRVPELKTPVPLSDLLPKRTGMLADATDEQLQTVMQRLSAEPEGMERDARLASIEKELQYREDAKTIENRPLSQAELFDLARNARTVEQQGAVLKAMERTRVPIASFDDLIGNAPQQRLLENVKSLFPSTAVSETDADREVKQARADYFRSGGDYRNAQAFGVRTEAPAKAGKMVAEGKRALAQGETEEDKGARLRAAAELDLEKAATDRALRDPRVRNLDAKSKNLLAATDKLRAEMARIKAKAASGGYRGGGKEAKADLETLKTLEQIQNKAMSEADVEAKAAISAASDAEKAAATARLRLMSIEPPGEPPRIAGGKEDPKVQAELAREKAIWERKNAAHTAAKKMLEDEETNLAAVRSVRDTAIAARKAAAEERKMYDPTIRAVAGKIAKRYGAAGAPAPAPAPVAQPQSAAATPTIVDGNTYVVGGKNYIGKGGKLVRVP